MWMWRQRWPQCSNSCTSSDSVWRALCVPCQKFLQKAQRTLLGIQGGPQVGLAAGLDVEVAAAVAAVQRGVAHTLVAAQGLWAEAQVRRSDKSFGTCTPVFLLEYGAMRIAGRQRSRPIRQSEIETVVRTGQNCIKQGCDYCCVGCCNRWRPAGARQLGGAACRRRRRGGCRAGRCR